MTPLIQRQREKFEKRFCVKDKEAIGGFELLLMKADVNSLRAFLTHSMQLAADERTREILAMLPKDAETFDPRAATHGKDKDIWNNCLDQVREAIHSLTPPLTEKGCCEKCSIVHDGQELGNEFPQCPCHSPKKCCSLCRREMFDDPESGYRCINPDCKNCHSPLPVEQKGV